MKTMKKRALDITLRVKFLLILAIALLLVFGITLATARVPYAAYDEQLYRSSVQTISMFANKLETEMDEISNLSFRILSDSVIQKNLTLMRQKRIGSSAWMEARFAVDQQIGYYSYGAKDILYLGLRTPLGKNFDHSFGGGVVNESEIDMLMEAAKAYKGAARWITLDGQPARLILTREVRETYHLLLNTLGVLVIQVDFDRIIERCLETMRQLGSPLSVTIYDGSTCLYSSGDTPLPFEDGEDGYEVLDIGGRQTLCVRATSRQGFRFVTEMPYDEIMSDIRQASQRATALSFAALLAAAAISAVLITSLLNHLQVLLRKFDALAKGVLPTPEQAQPYLTRRDEIGRLHRHFDRMAWEYDRVMRENYDKQLLIKEAQVRQLRAQIRPHFLYNTLESIYCLAKAGGDERIATMTDALGKMLRASLSDKRDVITVGEDLKIAGEYLRIQLLRYEDKLRVENRIEAGYMNVLIPSMTLQPLVENAVHHAAEEMTEMCVIRLFARDCEDGVEVIVEDNGPGMEEDILEKLETGEVQPGGLGIGLRNIHRRIQLAFTPQYGLRIVRWDGRTQVIVHVPASRQEGNDDV